MKQIVSWIFLCTLMVAVSGCGMLTDQDRKVVAEVHGEEITRADIRKLLRDMTDEERPIIQTQEDLLNTVNKHLNSVVLSDIANQLRSEGKIELSRDLGKEAYLKKFPEFRGLETLVESGTSEFTQGQIEAMKAQVAFGVDDEMEKLYQEAALTYTVKEYIKANKPKIPEEDFAAEYERVKESYKTYEYIAFTALRIPNQKGAQEECIKARQRILDGESFDAILSEYLAIDRQFGMRSAFENNPSKTQFTQFWHKVTGCKVGDIIGPLYLPSHDQVRKRPDGSYENFEAPASWLVLEVEEHRDPTQKTLEEAKPDMAMSLLRQQVLDSLRDDHGVKVYPEALWRPEGYGDQFKDSMINIPQQQ